jgi:Spy/CpxP family protein refolding chaperone
MKPAIICSTLVALLCAVSVVAQPPAAPNPQGRQGRQGRAATGPAARGGGEAAGVSPADVQKMFDAYAVMQAQEQLKIGDEQFAQFLKRYKALQDVRRKNLQERSRLVVELRQMLNAPNPDDAQLKEKMKALQDVEVRSTGETRKAYDDVDQMLDVRQQAKFRIFEELMERRKLELVTRARQANRPKNQQ